MATANPYQQYQDQFVYSLSPGELIVILYEEAVKNLRKAIININNKKICDAHNCIIKVQNIFLHLMDNLDMKYPISKELLPLYDFIYNALIKANMSKDTALLEDVLGIVTDFKNTWKEAEEKTRANPLQGGRK
jgi:flagellar protein FliS